jgi:hypothetical protein
LTFPAGLQTPPQIMHYAASALPPNRVLNEGQTRVSAIGKSKGGSPGSRGVKKRTKDAGGTAPPDMATGSKAAAAVAFKAVAAATTAAVTTAADKRATEADNTAAAVATS